MLIFYNRNLEIFVIQVPVNMIKLQLMTCLNILFQLHKKFKKYTIN